MQSTSHIVEALKSLMSGSQFATDAPVTSQDIDNIISAGLGPIFFHVLGGRNESPEIDTEMKLRASDLTSRAQSAEQFNNVESIISVLQSMDIDPILLKGASFAANYYSEPHLRIMVDVDLLLPSDRIAEAESRLMEIGFRKLEPAPGMNYDTHIHSAPLFHPERKLHIELHRRLLKDIFPAHAEVPLDLSTVEQETERFGLNDVQVLRFRPEFELMYLAAGWCYDLTRKFGRAGTQRTLFDCTLILKSTQGQLDWDTIQRWSNGTLSGACLYVLLSFLKRTGVYDDADNRCAKLGLQQKFVNDTTLRLMHDRIDKHVVRFGEFGPLSSSLTTSFMFDALIRKRAAWKNLLAMPGNIVFPRSEPRRFEFAYQIGRLRNAVRRQR